MSGSRWLCAGCRWQVAVTAGTVLQDSKLALMGWFRAMWQVTAQKNDMSALGLQRVPGLGSYKTAWTLLRKLCRAMVRPGRDRLQGVVEVDETCWGGEEEDVRGRETYQKALIAIASEAEGEGIGRIRLRHIPDTTRAPLHGFIADSIEPGSTVQTAAPRHPAASCSTGSPSKPSLWRRRPATLPGNTIRSGWLSHVSFPVPDYLCPHRGSFPALRRNRESSLERFGSPTATSLSTHPTGVLRSS